jgi:hypothetical protein
MDLTTDQIFVISFLVTIINIWIKMVMKLGKGYGLGSPITKFVDPKEADTFKKVAFNVMFCLITIAVFIAATIVYESVFLELY